MCHSWKQRPLCCVMTVCSCSFMFHYQEFLHCTDQRSVWEQLLPPLCPKLTQSQMLSYKNTFLFLYFLCLEAFSNVLFSQYKAVIDCDVTLMLTQVSVNWWWDSNTSHL